MSIPAAPRAGRLCAILAAFLLLATAATAATPRYSLVRVDLTAPGATELLRSHPELDVAVLKPGHEAEVVAREADLLLLERLGLPYTVVHADLTAYYASRLGDKGANFGVYHTYSEATQWLDDLHAQYPQVVSAKWSLGQSHEGRDIWCIRVSDNPETDEPDEAEVEIDGLHHAREVMASEMTLMFVEYLASRYGTDPVVTHLLDTREIYVVPIVNPDGFVYNETIAPDGGGMWRKNRRDNGDGTFGVDPNRNYPYEWDGPGSSTDPSSDVYRGPAPGSEPEVQALMGLINAHAFVTSMSFHSYSGMTLYPWGYTTDPTPDDAVFQQMASIMTSGNGYAAGQPGDLLYTVNGGSFDWVYGAWTEHPRCFAFTNEIGWTSDGFWPAQDRREPLFQDNLWPTLYLVMAADAFVRPADLAVTGGDGDAYLEAGETAGLALTLENLGVTADSGPVTVTLHTDDPYLQLHEAIRTVGPVGAMGTLDLSGAPFAVSVSPDCPADRALTVTVTADDGSGPIPRTFTFFAGPPVLVFSDDLEGGTDGWILTGSWATTTSSSHSATHSLTDSPAGEYLDQTSTSTTLASPVVLSTGSTLSFWHRYDIEDGWDYGRVQISADGGPWVTLTSFTGTQSSWTQETVDLSAYAGSSAQVRFLLETDYSVTRDGWYIDDIEITGGGSGNVPPPAPALVSPAPDATVGPTPTLVVADSYDPDLGDAVTYGFRVYGDSLGIDLVAAVDDLDEMPGQTSWTVPSPLPDGDYWWRAYAADPGERGMLGEWRHFTVNSATDVIGLPGVATLHRLGGTGTNSRWLLSLPRAASLRAGIYDLRGRRVRVLHTGDAGPGEHVLSWDGRTDGGREAASGVYLLRVVAGDARLVGRVVVVR